jgi:nicotinamide mononucleotide (NMN) deamidase PncC
VNFVAPFYKSKPAKQGGQAKAWIKKGTGTVKVKRSFTGVTHGAQGAFTAPPPGTVWMSPRARDRVDKHEREHTKKTKEIHATYIEPLEQRIAKYRGFFHAKKAGANQAAAIAALKTEIDWNSAVQSFATEDTNENTPMGPVDTNDMHQADFYEDFPTSAKFRQQSHCTIYEGVGGSKEGKT